MGQQNARSTQIDLDFDFKEYKMVKQFPDYVLWRNMEDPFVFPLIEEHRGVIQTNTEVKLEQEVYDLRRKAANVVGALQLNIQKVDEMCAQYYNKSLFLEKIYLRLSDLVNISLEDSLHMMIASIAGFKKLFDKFGFFSITEKMIGVDSHYTVKVWISENYSAVRPDHPSSSTPGEGTEFTLASMVVAIIWNCTNKSQAQMMPETPHKYMTASYQRLSQKSAYGLKQARLSLFEYAAKYRIAVSHDMRSMSKLIQQQMESFGYTSQPALKAIADKPIAHANVLLHTSRSLDTKFPHTQKAVHTERNITSRSPKAHQNPLAPFNFGQLNRKPSIEKSSTLQTIPYQTHVQAPSRTPVAALISHQLTGSHCTSTNSTLISPNARPRLISNNFPPKASKADENAQNTFYNSFQPVLSECLIQGSSPFGNHNRSPARNLQHIMTSPKNNEKDVKTRMNSPGKHQILHSVASPIPFQLRQNFLSVPSTLNPPFPQIISQSQQVPDQTGESRNKLQFSQTSESEMGDSIFNLIKRMDEQDVEPLQERN